MGKARNIANLVDANGDVIASALDNVPAANLIDDTTPQLGGNLDLNSNDITGTGNINITGTVTADGLTVDTNTLHVDATNNRVGIGTTTPNKELSVVGNVELYNDEVDGYIWFHDYGTASYAIGRDQSSDTFSINRYSDLTTNPLVTVTSGGSVGIGTTSPDEKLHVFAGSAGTVTASGNADLVIENSANSGVNILTPNNQNGQILFGDPEDNDVGRLQYNHTSNFMAFYTNANERMRIDSSGNVVLNNASYLQFRDSGGTARDVLAIDGFNGLNINSAGGGSAAPIVFKENGSEIARFDTSGNLGVGTSSPNANTKLDVNGAARIGNSTDGIMIENNSGAFDISNAAYIRRNSSSGAFELTAGSTTARDMIFNTGTNGAESMRIDSSGKVIITKTAVAGSQTASVTGSTTLDFGTYQNFILTLTGNITLANPTTEQVGQSGFITFIQTGGYTVSLGTDYETAGGAGITLSASGTDVVPYIVAASGRILLGAPQLAFA